MEEEEESFSVSHEEKGGGRQSPGRLFPYHSSIYTSHRIWELRCAALCTRS